MKRRWLEEMKKSINLGISIEKRNRRIWTVINSGGHNWKASDKMRQFGWTNRLSAVHDDFTLLLQRISDIVGFSYLN